MKQLLLTLIVCASALLPTPQAQAAPASKTYGGFLPGKTFTFAVKERIVAKTSGAKVTKIKNPPSGIPNFALGQRVKFTIGARGQLTAKGLSMPFKRGSVTSNVYVVPPATGSTAKANTGTVFKNSKGQPIGVALSFFKVELNGFVPTVYSVYYTLK